MSSKYTPRVQPLVTSSSQRNVLVKGKKMLFACTIVFLALVMWLLYISFRQKKNDVLISPKEVVKIKESSSSVAIPFKPSPIGIQVGTPIKITKTEDVKALGYTGQKKMVRDTLGNIYIAYRNKYNGEYQIFVAKLTKQAGGGYKALYTNRPIANLGDDATQRVPAISIAEDNTLYVTWYGLEERKGIGRQVKFSLSKDFGSTWSKWKNIALVSGYDESEDYWQEHPSIATRSENIYIVWEGKDKEFSEQQVKFTKSMDGGTTWLPWKNIHTTNDHTQSRPVITLTDDGSLHVLMYSNDGDNQQIWYSRSSDEGLSWTEWENISKSAFDSRHVDLVAVENKLHSVWREYREEKAVIMYAVFESGTWSTAQVLKDSSKHQLFPSIHSLANMVAVTWTETADSSDLPREAPSSGVVNYAILEPSSNELKFGKLDASSDTLYSHILIDSYAPSRILITALLNETDEPSIWLYPLTWR